MTQKGLKLQSVLGKRLSLKSQRNNNNKKQSNQSKEINKVEQAAHTFSSISQGRGALGSVACSPSYSEALRGRALLESCCSTLCFPSTSWFFLACCCELKRDFPLFLGKRQWPPVVVGLWPRRADSGWGGQGLPRSLCWPPPDTCFLGDPQDRRRLGPARPVRSWP